MRVSVVVFPGSNCDHDALYAFRDVLKTDARFVWHRSSDLEKPDLVVIPGGFSYGDYLRTGAMAKLSPIMKQVKQFAASGGPILGICNGFQILCESGLLPGVLLQNLQMRFMSRFVEMEVASTNSPFTKNLKQGDKVQCPVAHFEGNYFADSETIKQLQQNDQIILRYTQTFSSKESQRGINGAIDRIAGVCNKERNVLGLMPHPERAVEDNVGWIGKHSGLELLRCVVN